MRSVSTFLYVTHTRTQPHLFTAPFSTSPEPIPPHTTTAHAHSSQHPSRQSTLATLTRCSHSTSVPSNRSHHSHYSDNAPLSPPHHSPRPSLHFPSLHLANPSAPHSTPTTPLLFSHFLTAESKIPGKWKS